MNVRLALSVIAVATAAMNTPAFAQSNWYGGASVGQSSVDLNKSSFNATSVTTNSVSTDEKDTGYKLFAGYQFNKNFAVEAGWYDLGKFTFSNTTTGPAGTASGSIKANGLFASAVGTLPLNDQWALFGKVGAAYSTLKSSASTTGGLTFSNGATSFSSKKSDWNVTYGVGAEYSVTKTVAVRAEWERFDKLNGGSVVGKGDVDLLSVGVTVKF